MQLELKIGEVTTVEELGAQEAFIRLNKARMSFLAQKAKSHWMNEGDCNFAFFHAQLKKRKTMNRIFSIEDIHGNVVQGENVIAESFVKY